MALVHIDAGVVIGFLDRHDSHHAAARLMLSNALAQRDQLEMAASAFAECLVAPARRGEAAVRRVQEMFERFPIGVVGVNQHAAVVASKLRAAHRALRLPDALVLATAVDCAADELVTTDRKWPKAHTLKIRTKVTTL